MTLTPIITLIFFIFLIFIVLGTLAYGGILAAPYVPLWKKDVKRALDLADIKQGDILYDLGSGDGRIIIMASEQYGALCTGFEVAFLPFIFSYVKIFLKGLRGKACLKMKNFYICDLGKAQIITAFLSPRAMAKLKEKFEKELRPGTKVISCAFAIPGWEPAVVDKPHQNNLSIYRYEIK